jgi:hypothetical protein
MGFTKWKRKRKRIYGITRPRDSDLLSVPTKRNVIFWVFFSKFIAVYYAYEY